MYTLKIVQQDGLLQGEMKVKEREFYYSVGNNPEIIFYDSDNLPELPIAKVVTDSEDILVFREDSAYLVNDQGKTLKIINRVL